MLTRGQGARSEGEAGSPSTPKYLNQKPALGGDVSQAARARLSASGSAGEGTAFHAVRYNATATIVSVSVCVLPWRRLWGATIRSTVTVTVPLNCSRSHLRLPILRRRLQLLA